MVWITQTSRGCALLLLSLTSSLLPSLTLSLFSTLTLSLFPALTLSLRPTPTLSILGAFTSTTPPVSNSTTSPSPHTTISPIPSATAYSTLKPSSSTHMPAYSSVTPVTIGSSTSPTETSITTLYPQISLSATSQMSASPLPRTSPTTVPNIASPRLGKPTPRRSDLARRRTKPPLPLRHPTHPSPLHPPKPTPPLHTLKSPPPPPFSKTTPKHLHPLLLRTSSTSSSPKTSPSPPPKSSPSPFLSTSPTPPFKTSPSVTTSSLPHPQTSPSPLPLRTAPPRPPRPPLSPLPHTSRPLFEHHPFMVTWNIPDLVCNRFNISLDTSSFKGVATPAKVPGQFLSLFYTDRLGLYPHVDLTAGRQLNGGIPQRADLRGSMTKARADISYYITSRTSRGLAVIDWEEWRPLWVRNWGTKRIYQMLSVSHALQSDPSLTAQQAEAQAKQQFQAAARSFMLGTLALGRSMRPNYLWGFYLFPNCYNYGWLEPGYTGRCSKEVRGQNDELIWLWEASSALYPSVYLHASLADSPSAALMVRNRVQEALRVAALPRRSGTAPVFVYMRPVFIDQNRRFLSQEDLVSTIGESAAVGASGAVTWGASADYNDKASCEALSSYLSSTLNPYITNVTAAAQLCSDFLCQGNGRCVRKRYDSHHYLHLSPGSFRISRARSRYLVTGRPTFTDLKVFSRRFTCQCYEGLTCVARKYREMVKALVFRVKQGLYKKAKTDKTMNKSTLDNMEQSSIAKEGLTKTLKV